VRARITIIGTVCFCAVCAWTVLASRLFVWMGGLSAYFPSPWVTWWRYARQPRIDGSTLLYLIVSGIIAALPIGLLAAAIIAAYLRRRPRRLVPARGGGVRPIEGGVTDNHGHAQFAEPSLVAERFGGPGCLIGAVDRGERAQLLFDNTDVGPGHCMVFAGPGSHKTTSAITRIWNWRGPRVVFDPSCEIGPIMTEALQTRGCNVASIGLTGSGINALDWIDIRHPESDAHIRSAVDWIYNEGATSRSGGDQGRDPFWGTWGRALVTCIMAYMLHHPDPHAPRTLASLRRGIATPENDMQDFLGGIHLTSSSRMARDLAGGLMGMKAEKTFSGIYANAFAATEWLSVGAYADVVSGDAMRTSDILDSNTVAFIQLPLRTLLTTPAVGRAVMGALFNAMFHADGSGNTDRILFQIDEAWVLGAMKEIKLCHTTARKYRGAVSTIWQSEAQLEDVWGREGAKTMRDTVSWRSYNAVQDGDVAEKLSRDIGEHAVMAYSEGDNSGQSKPWGFALGSRSKGRNTNIHEIKRRLIKADEIMRARADEMFVLARDFPHPIRCVSAPYFRYPEIARRMRNNRFVTVA
jgi:type IV secretion system protein VirD4